jgi:hypothetical protein
MMCADCSETLANADSEINVVLRILLETPLILLVAKPLRSLASTSKMTVIANTGMTAASLTIPMLQRNLLPMVLLAMTVREVVVAVEEEGEEVAVVAEDEVEDVDVDHQLVHLLLLPLPLLLVPLQLVVHLRRRRTMKNK